MLEWILGFNGGAVLGYGLGVRELFIGVRAKKNLIYPSRILHSRVGWEIFVSDTYIMTQSVTLLNCVIC